MTAGIKTWRIQREGQKSHLVAAEEYLEYLLNGEQFEAAYVGNEMKWEGGCADILVYSKEELIEFMDTHYFIVWTDEHTIIFVDFETEYVPVKVPRDPVRLQGLAIPVS